MKSPTKVFAAVIGILVGASIANGQSSTDMMNQISNLNTSIQGQIEQIKAARSSTNSQLTLARLRIGQQIMNSEQDLALQMERLQQLKNNLQQQKDHLNQTVSGIQTNLSTTSANSISNIEDQLSQTSDLLNQLRQSYEQFTGEPDPTSLLTLGNTTTSGQSSLSSMTPSFGPSSSTSTSSSPDQISTMVNTSTTMNQPAPSLPDLSIQTPTAQPTATTTPSESTTSTVPAISPTPTSGGG
ncbi:MAG: hypothetical protein M1511_19590 [Deltaproteobacteria bacterium]|nr:hypothetical protein [Deltaproteobacteria bacterium]